MSGNYTITYSERNVGVAVHGVISVYDGNGNIIKSFEGLATDSGGQTKVIGSALLGDTIKGYYYNSASPNAISTPVTVYSGTQSQVMARVDAMISATNIINSQNTPYELPGPGSIISAILVIAHPASASGSVGNLAASTKRRTSRTAAWLALAVLTTERKAA